MTQNRHEAGEMIRKGVIEPAGVGFILSSDLAGCKRPRSAKVTQKLALPAMRVWCRLREGQTNRTYSRGPVPHWLSNAAAAVLPARRARLSAVAPC